MEVFAGCIAFSIEVCAGCIVFQWKSVGCVVFEWKSVLDALPFQLKCVLVVLSFNGSLCWMHCLLFSGVLVCSFFSLFDPLLIRLSFCVSADLKNDTQVCVTQCCSIGSDFPGNVHPQTQVIVSLCEVQCLRTVPAH